MSGGTCGTCRYAGSQLDEEFDDEAGYYVRPPHLHCTRIIHGNGSGPRKAKSNTPAYVVDGSGYAASLCVLPTFGCLLWEVRE